MSADILERLDPIARFCEVAGRAKDGHAIRDAMDQLTRYEAEIVRLRGEVKKLAAAVPVPRDPKAHQWNGDGERCLVCGDKDWMGGPCSGAMPNGVKYDRELIARMLIELSSMGSSIFLGESISAQAELLIAADNRDAAGVDSEEDAYVIERMGKLLAEIAVIVNGPEPDMTRWSYHDLPDKVRALKAAPAAVPAGEAVDLSNWAAHYSINPAAVEALRSIIRPPAPVQAAPQEVEKAAATLRDALKYVGYRQDGDLNTLAERAELWMRESKVLIAMQQELAARPSACELGELAAVAVKCGAYEYGDPSNRYYDFSSEQLQAFVAALQHRGDSQEVGRG